MENYTEKIRDIATRLLTSCKTEIIIGFRKGSMPFMNEPVAIRTPKETEQLIWDGNCGMNLSNFLLNRTEKIGVFAKGCDSRNIVTHIIEKKIRREQLYIIGIPCNGMIDRKKIKKRVSSEIHTVSEENEKIIIQTHDGRIELPRAELLQSNCMICAKKNPVIYDEMAGEIVPEQKSIDRYEEVRHIETMSQDERWKFFDHLLSSCIRCYACRNACPLCYCPVCFVDESNPQWLDKGDDPIDIRTFHFLRAYHCAGRCTDCGACERACPMDINMRLLTLKLEKDCMEQYGWQAGMTADEHPPLDTFKPQDSNEFIQ